MKFMEVLLETMHTQKEKDQIRKDLDNLSKIGDIIKSGIDTQGNPFDYDKALKKIYDIEPDKISYAIFRWKQAKKNPKINYQKAQDYIIKSDSFIHMSNALNEIPLKEINFQKFFDAFENGNYDFKNYEHLFRKWKDFPYDEKMNEFIKNNDFFKIVEYEKKWRDKLTNFPYKKIMNDLEKAATSVAKKNLLIKAETQWKNKI